MSSFTVFVSKICTDVKFSYEEKNDAYIVECTYDDFKFDGIHGFHELAKRDIKSLEKFMRKERPTGTINEDSIILTFEESLFCYKFNITLHREEVSEIYLVKRDINRLQKRMLKLEEVKVAERFILEVDDENVNDIHIFGNTIRRVLRNHLLVNFPRFVKAAFKIGLNMAEEEPDMMERFTSAFKEIQEIYDEFEDDDHQYEEINRAFKVYSKYCITHHDLLSEEVYLNDNDIIYQNYHILHPGHFYYPIQNGGYWFKCNFENDTTRIFELVKDTQTESELCTENQILYAAIRLHEDAERDAEDGNVYEAFTDIKKGVKYTMVFNGDKIVYTSEPTYYFS